MLRILARPDSLPQFWSFLSSMSRSGHSLDHGTFLSLLASFKRANLPSDRSALAQFYSRSALLSASDAALRSTLHLLSSPSDPPSDDHWNDAVESNLNALNPQLSEDFVAKVLRELRNRPLTALGFFRWAGTRPGYAHGTVAYNAMARALGRGESIEQFWSLIEEMKQESRDMDIDTYVKLSRHFQKCWMMKEAVELYERMMDGPYKPAVQDCGILLRHIAMSSAPDLELVYRVVRKYESAGYSLSKAVYDGIHRSLTSNGRFGEAEEIVEKMRSEGFEPDNITYSQLVYGLCKARRFDDAYKVFDEMEAAGCVPDLKTWTVLIQGHCTAGEVDKGLECLARMIEKNCEADADVLDILVKGLCGKSKAEGAYNLFDEMVERARLRPWQATYKHLISELLKVRMLEEALKLLGSMKKQNFPPFADPFPPYIAKFGTIDDARQFLKALTVNNYPSPAAYLNVFKAFFDEGRYSEAQDLLFKCPHHIRKHADISKLFGSIKPENSS
ncbi:pentatricopeptide repeat-containing protein At3g48250, chloroplastic [Ananas comosus]|nr:pentatricopeptide repeat-containing protein At3g48250, chloroplastic [Ananas comosus]